MRQDLYTGTSKWDQCCKCCAGVPYPSLVAWMLLIISVLACCGSIIAAEPKTNNLLKDADNLIIIPYQKEIAIGVMCGMLLFACFHLLVATLSSNRLRHTCFNTRKRNICGRVLNIVTGVLTSFLHIAWQVISTIIAIPLVMFVFLYYSRNVSNEDCFDLQSVALSKEPREMCGETLDSFYTESVDVMQCYAVAYVASILVVFSLKLIGMCAGANFAYVKESRFANFYAYKDQKGGKDSGNGTEMPLMFKKSNKA